MGKLLTVVFLSRNLEGDQIEDGDGIIQKSEVDKMDAKAQDYFKRVGLMKTNLRDLKLSPDENLAFSTLINDIHDYHDKRDAVHPAALENLIRSRLVQ